MQIKISYFIIIAFAFPSCIPKRDFIHKPSRTFQNNLPFKLSGTYYSIDKKYNILNAFIFFENGIQRHISFDKEHYNPKEISKSINKMIDEFEQSGHKAHEYFGEGGFEIKNSKITIQEMGYIPQFAWQIVTFNGTVINDSTIIITQIKHSKTNTDYTDSTWFHFIQTAKPDSLKGNQWRNRKWFWKK